LNKIKALVLI